MNGTEMRHFAQKLLGRLYRINHVDTERRPRVAMIRFTGRDAYRRMC